MSTPISGTSNNAPNEPLFRLAQLVASGEAAIPWHLSWCDLETVMEEVHVRRRQRLVTYISHAIARQLIVEEQSRKDSSHA